MGGGRWCLCAPGCANVPAGDKILLSDQAALLLRFRLIRELHVHFFPSRIWFRRVQRASFQRGFPFCQVYRVEKMRKVREDLSWISPSSEHRVVFDHAAAGFSDQNELGC